MQKKKPRLLKRSQVARKLNTTTRTVDKLIADGRIRAIRPFGGRAVRVELHELERFLKECLEESRARAGRHE